MTHTMIKTLKFSLTLLICALFSSAALAGGEWQNFSFNIDDTYSVSRLGPTDIFLYHSGNPIPEDRLELGPLYRLAVTDTHIIGGHYGMTPETSATSRADGPRVDTSRDLYIIIERSSGTVEGPLDEAAFTARQREMTQTPFAWDSLRKSYKTALADGRASWDEVDACFKGQLLFTMKNLHFFAFYALLPGTLIGAFFKTRKKKRPFLKGFGLSFSIILLVIVAVSLAGWLDLRYF